jgi:hypothetical protein
VKRVPACGYDPALRGGLIDPDPGAVAPASSVFASLPTCRAAIAAMCTQCIFVPEAPFSVLDQIAGCREVLCPLFTLRPLPKRAKRAPSPSLFAAALLEAAAAGSTLPDAFAARRPARVGPRAKREALPRLDREARLAARRARRLARPRLRRRAIGPSSGSPAGS